MRTIEAIKDQQHASAITSLGYPNAVHIVRCFLCENELIEFSEKETLFYFYKTSTVD